MTRNIKRIMCLIFLSLCWTSQSFAQMCLAKKPTIDLNLDDIKAIGDCQSNPLKCKHFDVKALCTWALDVGKTRRPLEKDDSAFAKVCDTCRSVAQYRCIDEADRAVGIYASWQKIFLEGLMDKPLAVVKGQISSTETNLLVLANMEELDAGAQRFTDFYIERSRALRAISKTFLTPDELSAYIRTVREEYKKIREFHAGTLKQREIFAVLIRRINNNLAAFTKTMTNMVGNEFCEEVKDKLEPLIGDSDRWRLLNEKSAQEYVLYTEAEEKDLIRFVPAFTNEAIAFYAENKAIPVELAKKEVNDILEYDDVIFEMNQWWVNVTINGIANGEHTLYLQYAAPRLVMESHKSRINQDIEKLRAFKAKGIKTADSQITKLERRLSEVQRSIDWIATRGWKGQWDRQLTLAKSRSDSGVTGICSQLVNDFISNGATPPVDQDDFERRFEAKYRTLARKCGAS